MNEAHWKGFWTYVYNRQLIWHKRFILREQPPWTNDPTLRNYSYTNAYRELDRGTLFCMDHVLRSPWRKLSQVDRLCRIVVYRFFNRIEVWDECIAPVVDNPLRSYNRAAVNEIESNLRRFAATGKPVFTGAFMVASYSMFPGHDKIERICNFIADIWEHSEEYYVKLLKCESPREVHKAIMAWRGVGPFNAYEFMSDMLYVPGMLPWTEDDWANPGPGAKRGLKLIYPERRDYEQAIRDLRDIQADAFDVLHLPFDEVAVHDEEGPRALTMRNIEHNLCEYSKYARGRARNKFKQHTFTG